MNKAFLKLLLSYLLLVFPILFLLAFALHFRNFEDFFQFKFKYVQHPVEDMFRMLIRGRGHGFIVAHSVVYAGMPFMTMTIICLGYILFNYKPFTAFIGTGVGIIGTCFLSGVIAAWLSFSAVGNVSEEHYTGAEATLTELVKMEGVLRVLTHTSYLSLIGMIILCIGLLQTKILPKWSPLLILIGSLLIAVFMDLDNWMFIGTAFILVGLIPISRYLRRQK